MTSSAMRRLAPAELVEFIGTDVIAFAQAQFSSDVSTLAIGDAQLSGWLDAKGNARYVFMLLRPESQRLLAWLPLGDAADMAVQLARYVFRAKLTISTVRDRDVFQASSLPTDTSNLPAHERGWTFAMPGSLRRYAALLPATSAAEAGDLAAWRLADIADGLPWLASELVGAITGAALDLARFAAISTNKGCYPGQEIIARLHFRGGNKRHCYRLRITDATLPEPGTQIKADSLPAQRGIVLYAAQVAGVTEALAVMPEALEAAADLELDYGARIDVVSRNFVPGT